jgi:hypothetical protein
MSDGRVLGLVRLDDLHQRVVEEPPRRALATAASR